MVRAESVTATLVYTYSADGLRVAQSVDGAETNFAWDWASGLPEMLAHSSFSHSSFFLVGHETLGRWDGADWSYYLPDALGSIRQAVDAAGAVVSSREWDPYVWSLGARRRGRATPGSGSTRR
jgi:hypothetical protein